ncbi:hypothetical protein [Dipodfec virus UOA04_Rod_386]|nr:hypothetical protein [Dipodfec virus UOA04_Rod_386]
MDINKFYHLDRRYDDIRKPDTFFDLFNKVLSDQCFNDNPIARLIFRFQKSGLANDLDIEVSPTSDPAIRAFAEALRSEIVSTSFDTSGLTDDQLFSCILPSASQFGDEITSYAEDLASSINETLSSLSSQKGGN